MLARKHLQGVYYAYSPPTAKLDHLFDKIKNEIITSYVCFGEYPQLHSHDYWEFVLVRDGAYDHTLNGKTSTLEKNAACLLRPKIDCHRLKNKTPDTCHYNVGIPDSLMQNFFAFFSPNLSAVLAKQKDLVFSVTNVQTEQIMSYDFLLNHTTGEEKQLIFKFLVLYILEILFNKLNLFTPLKPEWFTHLLFQINSPQNVHWQVQDVVDASNFSHTNLLRYFQKYEHCTISEYLEQVKMIRARDLLVYTNINILQIANQLGYSDSSHFNRAFKRTFGCSPSRYNSQVLNKNKKS